MRTLLTLLLLTVSFGAAAQGEPPPASVGIDMATQESMSSLFLAPGTIVSRNDARISAEVVGRLTWVAEVGERITSGEPIARIDDKPFKLRLRENNASIRRLEANAKYLNSQLDRYNRLSAQNTVTRDQVEELRSQIEMVQQDIVSAKVQREQTMYDLERTVIKAPFSGSVTERQASIGEFISTGGVVVRFVDVDNFEVRAQAPVSVARYLEEDMDVRVRDDLRAIGSKIRSIVGVGDERSRMVEVRVALDGAGWIIGGAVRVEFPQSEPALVVAVSRDALILRQNSTYLYKVKDDNTVEQIPVRTGIGNGSRIEVQGDVADGDRIVVRGGERLRSGQSVVVVQDTLTSAVDLAAGETTP